MYETVDFQVALTKDDFKKKGAMFEVKVTQGLLAGIVMGQRFLVTKNDVPVRAGDELIIGSTIYHVGHVAEPHGPIIPTGYKALSIRLVAPLD